MRALSPLSPWPCHQAVCVHDFFLAVTSDTSCESLPVALPLSWTFLFCLESQHLPLFCTPRLTPVHVPCLCLGRRLFFLLCCCDVGAGWTSGHLTGHSASVLPLRPPCRPSVNWQQREGESPLALRMGQAVSRQPPCPGVVAKGPAEGNAFHLTPGPAQPVTACPG